MRLLLFISFVTIATATYYTVVHSAEHKQETISHETTLDDSTNHLLHTGDSNTAGLAEESAAMGGEEFPFIPVGALHGDWLLVAVDHSFEPLLATQIIHELNAKSARGDVAIRAKGWNLGQTTGHESFTVKLGENTLSFVAELSNQTLEGEMKWDGRFWRGWMDFKEWNTELISVALISPYDLDAGIEAFFPPGLEARFLAVDERGQIIESPIRWDVIYAEEQDGMVIETATGDYRPGAIKAGRYYITASAGDLIGQTRVNHTSDGQESNQDYYVVLKPKDEGTELPIEAAYFCSEGERCEMQAKDLSISFNLPLNYGAEMPLKSKHGSIMFNMVKMTPQGAFWITLNQPQRMAELGPCLEIELGNLCHDERLDPDLLDDFQIIADSLAE